MKSPQVVVLTGEASGTGRHLAAVLVAQGHNVLVTDINEETVRIFVQKNACDDFFWPPVT